MRPSVVSHTGKSKFLILLNYVKILNFYILPPRRRQWQEGKQGLQLRHFIQQRFFD